jgi:hypothetical protein
MYSDADCDIPPVPPKYDLMLDTKRLYGTDQFRRVYYRETLLFMMWFSLHVKQRAPFIIAANRINGVNEIATYNVVRNQVNVPVLA